VRFGAVAKTGIPASTVASRIAVKILFISQAPLKM